MPAYGFDKLNSAEPIPIHDQATRYAGKRGDKSDGKGNGLGVGNPGAPMNTLTSADRHAVAYATDVGWLNSLENQSPTLLARQYKDPHLVVYLEAEHCITQNEGCQPLPKEAHEFISENNSDAPHQQDLLQAGDGIARTIACGTHAAGSHLTKTVIFTGTHYIVRRLTPTECARLQGFHDCWGHINQKTNLTDEEYQFWLEVRNTHAAINGKAVKDYTDKQMLTWYNKLWTDSAEHKMWGNGIALPPALYCLEGIVDALDAAVFSKSEEDDNV